MTQHKPATFNRWPAARYGNSARRPGDSAAPKPVRTYTPPPAGAGQSELQIYLREINRYPLLSAEEERELGGEIINENCQASREKKIRSNRRLVVSIAKRFTKPGVAITDL